jgi:hypothetical protein
LTGIKKKKKDATVKSNPISIHIAVITIIINSGGFRIFFFLLWGGGLINVFPWDIFYNIAVND